MALMNSGAINIKMHRLLQRQVSKFLDEKKFDMNSLEDFITAVNNAYQGFEEDHRQLERTLEVSSNELFKANAELRETKQNLEKIIEERTREIVAANKQLAKSEEIFRSLVETSYDMITILEADGTITYESPSAYRILGYDEADLIGKNCMEFIHPKDLNNVAISIQEILQSPGKTVSQEFRFKKKNGEYLWLESVGKLVDENEFVTGIVVNSRDVTERHKVQEQMNMQSRILDSMAANMPISIYSLDDKGNFMSCIGKALSPIKENTDGTIISHSIYDIMHGKKDEIRAAYEGNVVHFTWSVTHNYNEYYFENFIFPDESNAEAALVGFAIDVTKDKQRENKLQESYDSLERINTELDQYAHIVSHDLKAPLRAINNLSTWIEEDLGEIVNEGAKKNFEMMRGRIHRMEMLINGILEYSRAGRQHSKPEVFNTYEMVKDIVSVLSPSEDYTFTIQSDMPEIESDRLKIEQVFSNFISNAIKYNHNPNPEIKIGFKDSDTRYTFFVQDNGPGIDAEYHEKIFVIFQTLNARDKVESTGVGLAIVKKIVEEAGGNVWIESEVGKGATFFFNVPKLR
ncbi:MAG: PAS domain S-box protein [Sphingobacteriales bacterium JAD_PAG50586_3]|nr:MAG: PAS domain S-box protein [Sphingobacteriales bacterium JAD_PAG50586_3]